MNRDRLESANSSDEENLNLAARHEDEHADVAYLLSADEADDNLAEDKGDESEDQYEEDGNGDDLRVVKFVREFNLFMVEHAGLESADLEMIQAFLTSQTAEERATLFDQCFREMGLASRKKFDREVLRAVSAGEFITEGVAPLLLEQVILDPATDFTCIKGSVLLFAVKAGCDESVISELLSREEIGKAEKSKALLEAAANENPKVVELLLDAGADIEATDDDKRTPLLIALLRGNQKIAELLLLRKANPCHQTPKGETALMRSAQRGYTSIVRQLLDPEIGIDIDAQDQGESETTALMFAAHRGHAEIVQLLLEAGADDALKDDEGNTALMLAVEQDHPDVVVLLERGNALENNRADREEGDDLAAEHKAGEEEEEGEVADIAPQSNIPVSKSLGTPGIHLLPAVRPGAQMLTPKQGVADAPGVEGEEALTL